MSKKLHMASHAEIQYDLLGREVSVNLIGPACQPRIWSGEPQFRLTRSPFEPTCKWCLKLVQEAKAAYYYAEQEAKNLRLGRPTTPEDDYIAVPTKWKAIPRGAFLIKLKSEPEV